jgi:CubicO group peptidase (beta-lactamase class C family)
MVDGFVAPGFERVRDAFEAQLGDELGAGFAAVRDGEPIVNIWGGWANREQTRAWDAATMVPVYSTTKAVSAIVMAWLVDRGLLSYGDPASKPWPAFGAEGKDKVTLAETLAHQAGVPGFLQAIDPDLWLDPPRCAEAIAALAPLWTPGSASGYHPMTWGYIAGELARRASGRSLGSILREEICEPLGVDFRIGTPASEHGRIAEMKKPSKPGDFGRLTPPRRAAFFTHWAAPVRGSKLWREIEIPSANGHGTALAVARLYEIYATGGEIAGKSVLSARAFAQLSQRVWEGADLVLPFNVDWRAGVIGNSNGFYGPNPEALGHSGAGGSCGFGDPIAGVSVGYVMNKQSHHIMGDPRALKLIEALYTCF